MGEQIHLILFINDSKIVLESRQGMGPLRQERETRRASGSEGLKNTGQDNRMKKPSKSCLSASGEPVRLWWITPV